MPLQGKQYQAFGASKTLNEWSNDPRCRLSYHTLRRKVARLGNLEAILSGPQQTREGRKRILSAFGEEKTLAEWLTDPRCLVRDLQLIADRRLRGVPFEKAITTVPKARIILHSAFGESKTLREWAKDPRCRIAYTTLMTYVREAPSVRGLTDPSQARDMSDLEAILSAPQKTGEEQIRWVTAFGETKMASEWAADSRCSVSLNAICRRLDEGIDPEKAISMPRQDGGPLVEAFGEAKTISEWSRDPRCVVNRSALSRRWNAGEPLEKAMTRPSKQADSIGKQPIMAFGETKSLSEWAQDSRCVVSRNDLRRRLEYAMDVEEAITTPKRSPVRLVRGFGETKSVADWVRDPRCVVSRTCLERRLERGESLEEAITRPSRQKVARFWK